MKKIIRILIFASISFTATGCLDIIEEVILNKDGSGTYVSSFDITKLADTYSIVDSTGQMMKGTKKTLDSTFEVLKNKIISINGVSAAYLDKSEKNVIKLRLNFTDINVLNKVLDQDKEDVGEKNLYSQSKGKLTRKEGGINSLIGDIGGHGEEDKSMMSPFLADMKYRIIYHLPAAVKKMTNEDATLSNDKKTVTLEVTVEDVKEKRKTLSNEIKY